MSRQRKQKNGPCSRSPASPNMYLYATFVRNVRTPSPKTAPKRPRCRPPSPRVCTVNTPGCRALSCSVPAHHVCAEAGNKSWTQASPHPQPARYKGVLVFKGTTSIYAHMTASKSLSQSHHPGEMLVYCSWAQVGKPDSPTEDHIPSMIMGAAQECALSMMRIFTSCSGSWHHKSLLPAACRQATAPSPVTLSLLASSLFGRATHARHGQSATQNVQSGAAACIPPQSTPGACVQRWQLGGVIF